MPAFSGLFAPYWKSNARGVFAGLTRYVNAGHIARATLEATAFQTREVMDAMESDSGVTLNELKVDGGMVANDLLMQFQADILGVPVIRPEVAETTALGASYAAGLAVGFWSSTQEVRDNWAEDKRWEPHMDDGHARRVLQVLEAGRHPDVRLVRPCELNRERCAHDRVSDTRVASCSQTAGSGKRAAHPERAAGPQDLQPRRSRLRVAPASNADDRHRRRPARLPRLP